MTTSENRLAELTRPSREFPRRYAASHLMLNSWSDVAPYFDELAERPIQSASQFEDWLLDLSELSALISEEESRRYIAMTCATDDAEAEAAFTRFIEEISPRLKEARDRMNRLIAASPFAEDLQPVRYEVFLRSCRNAVELFREENVPLETELDKLSQKYQKIFGAMTVEWEGCEITIPQALAKLEESDRAVRQRAFELVANRRLADKDGLEDLFDEMIAKRQQIARNAGFKNYRDYKFRELERFDYSPEDCARYADAVEQHIVPIVREQAAERTKNLKLESLRPWDVECDPLGRAPLHPFKTADELSAGCSRIFHRLDSGLAAQFDRMIEVGLLDLSSRKGKAPGGYQGDLSEVRLPFIFMNAVGTNDDVATLLHEAGHAFHNFAVREEPLHAYRRAPMEISEVASMSMELLAMPFLDEFYSKSEQARTIRSELSGKLSLLAWIATIDSFQHWVYTHEGHTRDERKAYWRSLLDRFGAGVNFEGYENARDYRWHAQLHIFEVPFYYIEYGIAQLGALQVWSNSRKNSAAALRDYKRGLALGGSRPLPKLFEASGIRFDFSAEIMKSLAADLRKVMAEQARLEI
jgi:oligoendopeptidase F